MPSINVSITDEAKATLDRVAKEVSLPVDKTASDLLESQLRAEKEHYDRVERDRKR